MADSQQQRASVPVGLTSAEARRRLTEQGPNTIKETAERPWRRALGKLWAPVPWMLEAAILLQLVLGEYSEAAVIGFLLLFNTAVGFIQEGRTQTTLDAMRSRLALFASVRRDGAWIRLPVAELVPGDVVQLSLGDVVGADVRLLDGEVSLDQSMLTGESLPLEAHAGVGTYAGALVRRGEALAVVTATGSRTQFGRTAELVGSASGALGQQTAVLSVVRNLAIFSGCIVVAQVLYAAAHGLKVMEIIPLALTAVLAAIPVALPATFTLASAMGARALARLGVLPTRLSAIDEAATMDVLCVDKTGTLTQNELSVTVVRPLPGYDPPRVLALAALASSAGGDDPVDAAVRHAAAGAGVAELPERVKFVPFDPASRTAEAVAVDREGRTVRIMKGAFAAISAMALPCAAAGPAASELLQKGFRVLAVAEGPAGQLRLAGLMALSDPPRSDSAPLIAELRAMGVHVVMLTGDAAATAGVVAQKVGLEGRICPPGRASEVDPRRFDVFAGVFPADKFHIVRAFQSRGHTVGMCGDGVNDAPALRQAQMGIAVSTATDVAKSAAGIVLTEPGLASIVAAVREGRIAFQRILTYTLRSVTRKIDQMLFLTVGLVMTGHAILTPQLMVLMMTVGDFLAMSSTTDNVRPSEKPNAWRINNLTVAGIVLGTSNLIFCSTVLAVGKLHLGLPLGELQTLAAVTLVFSGQSVFYVARERRRLWSSVPSRWVIASSVADVSIIATLAIRGVVMTALPASIVIGVLAAAILFAFVLDSVKVALFLRLRMT